MTIEPRFIQIHSLHTYPAALLNRDDAGLAKRLPFGGVVRTRISSQCLKRHWRITDDPNALSTLEVPMAIRSRALLARIRQDVIAADIPEHLAQVAMEGLRDGGLLDGGDKDKDGKSGAKGGTKKKANPRGDDALYTNQAVLMGCAEVEHLAKFCVKLAQQFTDPEALRSAVATQLKDKAWKKNLAAMQHGSGLESALFGRMVTSDILASRDAAIYVAHALTVHGAEVEYDYFTVVDDLPGYVEQLRPTNTSGAAGVFDTELASGLYYGYVVVDVRQLVENLEAVKAADCFTVAPAQRALAAKVVHRLLHLIATVSPGAKRGSTAPFDWARLLLVEAGDWQPRSLAGAFHNALPLTGTGAILARATERLAAEVSAFDAAYGAPVARRCMGVGECSLPASQRLSLSALADWTAGVIEQGAAQPEPIPEAG